MHVYGNYPDEVVLDFGGCAGESCEPGLKSGGTLYANGFMWWAGDGTRPVSPRLVEEKAFQVNDIVGRPGVAVQILDAKFEPIPDVILRVEAADGKSEELEADAAGFFRTSLRGSSVKFVLLGKPAASEEQVVASSSEGEEEGGIIG